jgi:valyl-tRNA synthetase
LIGPAKEKDRMVREIDRAMRDLQQLQKRFENPDFVAKAPVDVVSEGKANMAALDEKLLRLRAALRRPG